MGLDVTAARQAVVDFLKAYAGAAADNGAALDRAVGSTRLARWAHWLEVQNASFPGEVTGALDIRSLDFVGSATIQGVLEAQVNLSATVTLTYRPDQGPAFQTVRQLDGPVTLFHRSSGDWAVVDITRDGQSMFASIQLFTNQIRSAKGITVQLDSLFTFAPSWSFNVIVRNSTGHAISLNPKEAAILTRLPGQPATPANGLGITPTLARIPAGATVEGSMDFPTQSSASGRVLRIPFRAGNRVVSIDFQLSGIVTPAAIPSPTATAPAPGATS